MKITSTPLTITQLLSTQSEKFVIPAYQRRYSWQAKHIRELFDDVNQLENNDSHLLGSIVCLTSSHGVGVNVLELVDGQQRTTTIMLFLKAIEERLHELGKDEDAKTVANFCYCQDYTGKKASKLQPGDLDAKDFEHIMLGRNLDEVANQHLLNANTLIHELIWGLSEDALLQFKFKFLNSASIIRLDVADSKDAFKLFETINNRGLTLSPADIIKNFLLGNASLVDDQTLEAVKDDWTKLVVVLDNVNMDDFFRQYTIGLLGRKVPNSKLIDTFKRYYARNIAEGAVLRGYTEYEVEVGDVVPDEKLHITDFVADLRKAAATYAQIVQANTGDIKIDRHLDNLRKIRSVVSYIFVLNFMRRAIDRKDKLAILGMLETFMLRRNVAEYRTNELEDIFARLTRLPDEYLVERTYGVFRDNLPSDEEFYAALLKRDFSKQSENTAKYMLERLEYDMTGNTGEKYIAGGEEVHLEHIMPQTITTKKAKEEYGDWEAYLGPENAKRHGEYVAKLGNLTLLGAPLNIRASNNPFKSKQVNGIDESKSKETDYSQSTIELTRQLLDYDEFKFPEIESRTKTLAERSVAVWTLPIYEVPQLTEESVDHPEGIPIVCDFETAHADAVWLDSGSVIVRKGSTAIEENRPAFNNHNYNHLKQRLLRNGVLVKGDNALVFTQDYEFDSPSAAAAVILARAAAGPDEWKDSDGKTLKSLLTQR